MEYPVTQRHNLRQRKKLHLGEFQELGFYIDLEMTEAMPDQAIESFIDAFLVEIIEPRNLVFAGGDMGGFICRLGRSSATEEDRTAVEQWLAGRAEPKSFTVAPLVDAWYD